MLVFFYFISSRDGGFNTFFPEKRNQERERERERERGGDLLISIFDKPYPSCNRSITESLQLAFNEKIGSLA